MDRVNTSLENSNREIKPGSIVVLKDFVEAEHEGACFRDMCQSDHLAIYAWIQMESIVSLRQPRIDKLKILSYFEQSTKYDLRKLRQNFIIEFKRIRNRFIVNLINNRK